MPAITTEEKAAKRPRGVTWIAFWLLLSAAPFFYQLLQRGEEAVITPSATLELAYVSVVVVCAIGLLNRQEWARKGTVAFFIFYFFWSVWVVNYFAGSPFDILNKMTAEKFFMSVHDVRKILLGMLGICILWPVIVVFYLTCPPVKIKFQTRRRK